MKLKVQKFTIARLLEDGMVSEAPSRKKIVRRPLLSAVIWHCINTLHWKYDNFIVMKENETVYKHVPEPIPKGHRKVNQPSIEDIYYKKEGEPNEHYWRLLHKVESLGYVDIIDHPNPADVPKLRFVTKGDVKRRLKEFEKFGTKYVVVIIDPESANNYVIIQYNDYHEGNPQELIPKNKTKGHLLTWGEDKKETLERAVSNFMTDRYKGEILDEVGRMEIERKEASILAYLSNRSSKSNFIIDLKNL